MPLSPDFYAVRNPDRNSREFKSEERKVLARLSKCIGRAIEDENYGFSDYFEIMSVNKTTGNILIRWDSSAGHGG